MEFTHEEKKIVRLLIEKHMAEVEDVEKLTHDYLVEFSSEVEYSDKLKAILRKLR